MFSFGFTEVQKLLRRSFREFLERECPLSEVREIEASGDDYSPSLYQQMADLGWVGSRIPVEFGGSGMDWLDLAIFYEEAGRGLLPSPHWISSVLSAEAILALGTEEQKQALLPRIASGQLIVSTAYLEPSTRSDLGAVSTVAVSTSSGYTIAGTKVFVRAGHLADYLIVLARTGEREKGLFLLPKDRQGLKASPLVTLSGERMALVELEGVQASAGEALGPINREGEAFVELLDQAKLLLDAEMIGASEQALGLAVEYAKQRTAFGRPIGSFQALQHKMSNMHLAINAAKVVLYYAVWLTSQAQPAAAERAMAHIQAGEAFRLVTAEATQVFGGVGVSNEADIALYFRKAKPMQLLLGSPEGLREQLLVAQGV